MGLKSFVERHPLALRWHYAQFRWKFIELHFSCVQRAWLKNKDFSIIGNDCIAGSIYHKFGVQYKSPTIWTYIFPGDYIRLLENLEWYLNQPMEFRAKSQHVCVLTDRTGCVLNRYHNYPIGVLGGNVEIQFTHCKTESEALDQWNKRIKRMNWNNLFIVFNDDSELTEEYFEKFTKLDFEHKLWISPKSKRVGFNYTVFVKDYLSGANNFCFRTWEKNVNLAKWLNGCEDFVKN